MIYMHFAASISTVRLQQRRWLGDSSRGAGDVEPLVNARVDRRGSLVLALGDVELARVSAVVAVRDSDVGAANNN